MTTAPYPSLLAGGMTQEDFPAPFQLWAGESDLVTSQGTAGANLAQFTVIMRGGTGGVQIVAWDGTTAGAAIGFLAQPAATGGPAVFYTGGVPNHEALVWPAGVATLDARKKAFDGSNITVSALL